MAWIVVLILCLVSPCVSFIVTVEPHEEECFFDRVSQGTKMTLMFEVIEGGFLDIDVKVGADDRFWCSSIHKPPLLSALDY